MISFVSDNLELSATKELMTKEGVGNNQKDTQTLVHEKENKESDGVDDQDENADDLCGESDYRNEPLPCSLTMHSKNG